MKTPKTRRAARLLAAVAGLAAATLALSGCLYAMIPESLPDTPGPTAEPDASGVPAELRPFYEQTLTWTGCGTGLDCTDVTAPLDWEDPGAGTIELAVVRHRALNGSPVASLLLNPGGPGASGVDLVVESLGFAVGAPLIESFDTIGFDPRGVGQSTAVRCFDASEMDAYLYDIPAAPRGTPEWEDELTEGSARFAEACEANSGGILPYITTVNSARDLDLLRGVLGDSQLHYLGFSYGTFLGATYAELFPERAGRLVLDGAMDPSVPSEEIGLTQVLGFEAALRAYMESCLSAGSGTPCPFTGTVDEALSDLNALLTSVDRAPLANSDGRSLGADALVLAIITTLYSQDSWGYLTQTLAEVLQGDPRTAFFLADFYNGRENGVYVDNSTEAFRAYNCMDYPVDPDADDADFERRVLEGAPTIGAYMLGPDPCTVWPHPAVGTRGAIAAEGAAPIVVIGTTNDPATPYQWAVGLADQLSSGVLVTRVGEGHTGYNQGNRCVDRAVEDFLISGVVPQDGLRCE